MMNFQDFVPQIDALFTTFNKTRALVSIKYVAEESINVLNLLEIYELIGLHYCVLP